MSRGFTNPTFDIILIAIDTGSASMSFFGGRARGRMTGPRVGLAAFIGKGTTTTRRGRFFGFLFAANRTNKVFDFFNFCNLYNADVDGKHKIQENKRHQEER